MQKQRSTPPVSIERLTSSGSVIVALLAGQHHALHLLLMFGLGGAGMGVMGTSPTLRRAMLLVALALAAVTAYRLVRHHAPPYQRAVSLLSLILTLGLLAWSVVQFGL
jgi:hypothetical protein